MNEDDKKKDLIQQIRTLAGELGRIGKNDLPEAPDAEEYDFQVQVGLAEAAVEIMDTDVSGIAGWFVFCLIQYGIDPDDRIKALRDALAREVMSQMDAMEDDEEES